MKEEVKIKCPFPRLREYPDCFEDCPDTDRCPKGGSQTKRVPLSLEPDSEPDWAGARHHPELNSQPDSSRLLTDEPRTFIAYRKLDITATHDENQVNPLNEPQFEGVVFSDGKCAIRWLTKKRSVAVWDCFEDMMAIHGHPEYGTEIIWHETASICKAQEQQRVEKIWDEIICPMCYRLNPQHATADYGKGCHSCEEREQSLKQWENIK